MVNSLMTTTLPTIVGMGVVTRTTETMFGENKRGKNKQGRSTKMASKGTAKSRSEAAKKAWRTRRKRYGKDGRKG